MSEPKRICICLPHNYTHFQKEFVMSLLEVQAYFYEWVKKEGRQDTLSVICQGGVQLDEIRNKLVKTALANEQTHLMLMDTDQVFPRDLIPKMIEDFEDNPEIEAVTGIYHWKRPPFIPHIYGTVDKKGVFGIAGEFPMNELFQVAGAATGCLMVKADVFRRVKYPWFKFGSYGDSMVLGEDLYFCFKAKPLMLCDPRIRCLHLKTVAYGMRDYLSFNKIEPDKDGNFQLTPEQVESINRIHQENAKGSVAEFSKDE